MTTWIFNVLRELLIQEPVTYLWIEPGSKEEALFITGEHSVLAKCHHFNLELAESADLVIYSYRDLRTASVSSYKKFGSPCSHEQIESWIEAGRKWKPYADMVLRYESIETDPLKGIDSIRKLMETRFPSLSFPPVSDVDILHRIEERFQERQPIETTDYDPSTLIFARHRTYQSKPLDLPEDEKAIYLRVEKEFGLWLSKHGYLLLDQYGQDLDFRIAAELMEAEKSSLVLDVGMEHGSFTEMALRAGAKKVIGFECLPRHLDYLMDRFRGESRVAILPHAISKQSGLARLCIATDSNGKEFDFYHTLNDVEESSTLFHWTKYLEVQTSSLADLASAGLIPDEIHFLKIDTDGHDLAVLQGLGNLRPRVIMAEYWDTLPETSGKNPYTLKDLADWASMNGYSKRLTVRRNGSLELVEADSTWSYVGDWGNVFFFRDDLETSIFDELLQRHAREKWKNIIEGNSRLLEDNLAKEVEIRRLDHAVKDLRLQAEAKEEQIQLLDRALIELRNSIERGRQELREQQQNKEAQLAGIRQEQEQMRQEFQSRIQLKETLIQEQSHALKAYHLLTELEEKTNLLEQIRSSYEQKRLQMEQQLQEKERVITELDQALRSYRSAFRLFRPLLQPWQRSKNLVRSILRPRLGTLNQHPARELILPASYGRQISLNSPPKISLVTPSFRQADFIERTLKSVLDQNYPNLEYFVQDGGSEDGTTEILTRYSNRLAGWQSAPDEGQSYAINLGLKKTSGEIMAWLNSDDILLPGSLFYIADFFQRHPKVDVVYGHRFLIDENDKLIGRWMVPVHDGKTLSWADYIPQETLFWRRRIWEKVGGKVDETFQFAIDWDLLLRFRDAGAVFHRLPRFLGGFRVHSQQKTSAEIGKVGFEEMARIRRRLHGQEPTPLEIRKALLPYLSKHIFIDLLWRIRRTVGLHY